MIYIFYLIFLLDNLVNHFLLVFKKIDYIYFYYMLCPHSAKQSKANEHH